ncbi:alpha/beta fold hydrolase [Caenimonas koreensis]|uniref:alpha/beta fold hydrolase n=1 Tax=Caenimonas koreensis TaxID=367474 RepID=UPI003784B415
MGLNRGPQGDFDEWLARLDNKVRELHDRQGRTVSIIGWSLGGIYAREIAKRAPQLVRHVVTLGSPFGGVEASNGQTAFRLLNRGGASMTPAMRARLRLDPPVPATAIYSRTDGVVAWRSCMLQESATARNFEVSGASHCGMGVHPQVLRIVVDRLAAL